MGTISVRILLRVSPNGIEIYLRSISPVFFDVIVLSHGGELEHPYFYIQIFPRILAASDYIVLNV